VVADLSDFLEVRMDSGKRQGRKGREAGPCCRVEALVGVDERGQMVLPKEVRERAGIRAGDKLAVVMWEKEGEVCCLVLMKADKLNSPVRDLIGPAPGA
jgi:AbrB family looped-hinge helix DNA binding protein